MTIMELLSQMFNDLRGLSQAILQNGGTINEVIELYSTNSIREMRKTFRDLMEKQDALQQQQIQQQQAELEQRNQALQMEIEAKRIENVPGTHSIFYDSEVDQIEIKHTAHSREGFALGAVVAAEWLVGKKGVFTMKDVLGLTSK